MSETSVMLASICLASRYHVRDMRVPTGLALIEEDALDRRYLAKLLNRLSGNYYATIMVWLRGSLSWF